MNVKSIIHEIDNITSKNYSKWYIGITEYPVDRKMEHGDPSTWKDWSADTKSDARAIEKHFLAKEMKGDAGGGITPTCVYIY